MIGTSCAYLFPGAMLQSHARVVKSQPGQGGVISITQGLAGEGQARMEAQKIMEAQCRGAYSIVEEGEVVVGKTARYRNDRNRRGGSGDEGETRDIVEWHINYKCKLSY